MKMLHGDQFKHVFHNSTLKETRVTPNFFILLISPKSYTIQIKTEILGYCNKPNLYW